MFKSNQSNKKLGALAVIGTALGTATLLIFNSKYGKKIKSEFFREIERIKTSAKKELRAIKSKAKKWDREKPVKRALKTKRAKK